MPATNTGLFKAQKSGKGTREGILKAMEKKRAKTEQMKTVLNGLQKAGVRDEIRAASRTISLNKRKVTRRRSRSQFETRRHSKGDGKGKIKVKGPKGISVRLPESREDRIPQTTTFGDTLTADHKVLDDILLVMP